MDTVPTPADGFGTRFTGSTEYRRLLFAMLAGILVTLGLPPIPGTGLLVPLGLAWFFLQLAAADRPARLAWFFGLVHQLSLLHWLFFLIPAKTIPTRALVPVQALAAILYVSLFYLVFGWAVGMIRRYLGRDRILLLVPVLYVALEIVRDRGELAFPWCLTGSAVVGGPLLVLARTGGEMAVGAVLVFTAAALATVAGRTGGRIPLTIATVLLWVVLGLGSLVGRGESPLPAVSVAAVQADVPLDVKWDPAQLAASTEPYARLTEEAARKGAEFVVWAETAIPAYVRYDRELMNWVRDLARDQGVHLYSGFPDAQRNPEGKVEKFNSSGLFDKRGILVDRYAKHHLLPIGEAMPFTAYLPFLAKVDVGQAEWTPGPAPNVMTADLDSGPFRFSGLICFESILARQARESVRRGSTCLVVLTNDGWFGKTAGPRQHAAMALLRAAECGVPLVRCANNGISLVCDNRGRAQDSLGLGRQGVVQAVLTPYPGRTLFIRAGNLPLVLFLSGWTLLVALKLRKEEI